MSVYFIRDVYVCSDDVVFHGLTSQSVIYFTAWYYIFFIFIYLFIHSLFYVIYFFLFK